MIKEKAKKIARIRRQKKIRKKIFGTNNSPRLCVSRTLNNIYAQLVNDAETKTLAACSTLSAEIKDKISKGGNIEAARLVGELIAQKAKIIGIKKVVFDRAGYLYHGRVKALAEEVRKNGLEF